MGWEREKKVKDGKGDILDESKHNSFGNHIDKRLLDDIVV